MIEWFVELGYQGKLAAWLAASFLLYFFATQLAWQYRHPGREDVLGRGIDRVRGQPFTPLLGETIRFIYYLGIPFLTVVTGVLGADLLGISGTDWVNGQSIRGFLWQDWARGLGLAATAVLAMWGVWLVGRATSHRSGLMSATLSVSSPSWQRLLSVFYDQIHWAFYRSGPVLWLGDPYWGVFAGLALVLLETGLNPALRWALQGPESAGPPLIRVGMAWVSALLFLMTRNLWLTTAAHLALIVLIADNRTPTAAES